MAEEAIVFVSALGAIAPGLRGRHAAEPGVIVGEMRGARLATVTGRKGRRGELNEAVRSAFGIELPDVPRRVEGRGIAFIWSGPDQWLAHAPADPAAHLETLLAGAFADLASVVEQSDGQVLLRVAGSRIRDALAKGLAVDLHPRAFQRGYAAVTAAFHVGVHFWQIDDRPTYEFAVPRSYGLSFWHWLEQSAAEYGLEFKGAVNDD